MIISLLSMTSIRALRQLSVSCRLSFGAASSRFNSSTAQSAYENILVTAPKPGVGLSKTARGFTSKHEHDLLANVPVASSHIESPPSP